MRLALKLAASLTAGIGAVLAVQAVVQVDRVSELQEREIQDDVRILARAMVTGASELWALDGAATARRYVERNSRSREMTNIEMIDADELRPNEVPDETVFERAQRGEHWIIRASAPVHVGERTVAVLRIERELRDEREYFSRVLSDQVQTTLLVACASGLLTWLLGAWLIGKPLQELTALARRVADGDFSLRTRMRASGEIGDLARELDAMTDRLAASQLKIHAERRARTSALEQLRHADRLSTVGKLASSMAHELGTPLNVVAGRAKMVAADDDAPELARENGRIIAEQAERMTAIIQELLDFSRRKPLDKRRVRIGDVLQHAATLLEPICEDQDITLSVGGDPDLDAEIDAGKTLQVATNLLMNAAQAMPDGGRIDLDVRRRHVADPPDRRASEGDYVEIVVKDEGVGIPEERLADIFDAFFTTKKGGTGTGLGLSVCHGIVREHGGWIEVESTVGEGTEFRVYLPEGDLE